MWPRRAKAEQIRVEPEVPATPLPVVRPSIVVPKRGRLTEDIVLGLFGIALGLGAAFFPWYVFFNQEKFGIAAVRFDSDVPPVAGISSTTPLINRIVNPEDVREIITLEVDTVATGTTAPANGGSARAVPAEEQPFPQKEVPFRVVHIENGRAMIEDASGLWVVQRGSTLPDLSRVTAIEQRDGEWVLVTNADRVLTLSR